MHWSHCCSKFNYICAPKDRQENSKNKNHSFCVKLINFELPLDLLKGSNESYMIRASLFDFNYKEFLGKQWNSSLIRTYKKTNDVTTFELNESIFFHTSFIDESLAVIFEVIRYTSEKDQLAIGWGIFSIFKPTTNAVNNNSSQPSEKIAIGILKGTARALLSMDDVPERYPGLQKYDKSFINLAFTTNQSFDSFQYLVPENFLLHDDDKVPGLEMLPNGKTNFRNPVSQKFNNYSIEKLKIVIEPSLFEFETNFKKLLNSDRIARDNITATKDPGSLKIVERRLRVGVHNGYTFVEDNETVCLNVHDSKVMTSRHSHTVKSASSDDNTLKAKNAVEVSLPEDNHFALIFFLEYVVSESKFEENRRQSIGMAPSAQHTYQIGWAIYQPFNQQISPISLMDGVKLELELSGGSDHAPEDVLVYRVESVSKTVVGEDGESSEYRSNGLKLTAVMRAKGAIEENEPVTVVKRTSMAYSEIPSDRRVLSPEVPEPKMQLKEEQQVILKEPLTSKSEIYDAQIRQHQQFLKQQQMQQSWYDQGPLQRSALYLGRPAIPVDETITNYKDIEPYVISPDSHPSTRGRAANMMPLQMRSHSALGLSRATYSRIYAAGFPELVDCNGNHPFVIEPSDTSGEINWLLEERDSKDCDEVVFQFMAMSRYGRNLNDTKSVFFTFQFYRFPHVSTERLKLDSIIDSISNYEAAAPMILRKTNKEDSVVDGPPGTMVRYMLDPAFMKLGERYSYLEYMSQQTMYIDVWDGDSLMLIGSCGVNLKNMCRQGKVSVQMTYELDIINQNEIEEGNVSSIKGRLHLTMANLGSTSKERTKKMTLTAFPKKGLLVDATQMESFSGGSLSMTSSHLGGSLKNIYKTEDMVGSRIGNTGIVVRPQRAASKHRELAELLESRDHGNAGNVSLNPTKTPLMNENVIKGMDHDKAKKLARLKNLLKTLPSTYDKSDDDGLLLEAKRNDKAEQLKQLQIIHVFRDQQKKENIRLMLNGVVQREVTLYPQFGTTEIFEVKIKNHFDHDSNIQIEITDDSNSLAAVLNPYELKALKNLYSITTSSEDGLITMNKDKKCPEIFMRAKESVLVPFKYTNLIFQSSQIVQEPSVEDSSPKQLNKMSVTDIEKQIVFRTSDGKLLSMIRVKVFPQPAVVDQTFRFFHPEQSFLKRIIRLPPMHIIAGPSDSIKALTRSSDSSVVTECQQVPVGTPSDVFIKVNCGPHPEKREFLLAVYVDKFLLKPIQVWQFAIHSQKRVDIVGYQGQTSHFTLLLKGSSNSHRVNVYSSHPKELSVGQIDSSSFTLVANSTCELNLSLTPLVIGSRTFYVNVVDVDTHRLVTAWSICAICKEPEVSKVFELEIPANGGEECKKKIGYQNPYGQDKRFFIITDRQDLIMFKESILKIGPNKVEYIGIVFLPVMVRGRQKIFVFINDEDGKNEETFSLIVNYV